MKEEEEEAESMMLDTRVMFSVSLAQNTRKRFVLI